jgi:hypothetical protein
MEDKKNKKVNHLSVKDCETILFKLSNQQDSKYYRDVFCRLKRLTEKKK